MRISSEKKEEIRGYFASELEAWKVAEALGVSEKHVYYWWTKQFGREARLERSNGMRIRHTKQMGYANRKEQTACTVAECDQPQRYRTGLCPKHEMRRRKHGDPLIGGRPDESVSDGTIDPSTGYRRVSVRKAGQGHHRVYEHRHVMEQQLGRPLRRDEQVHHRNGDRLDNRPENLELWSTSQPYGQRVEDLVTWARWFVSVYPTCPSA